ncbi:unnamed protein product, partial [Heterobilharzia americana]
SNNVETETSWFTAPRTEKQNTQTIVEFFDKQTDLDRILGTFFPKKITTKDS